MAHVTWAMTKEKYLAAAFLIAGFAVMLALNAPGQLSYDSVSQLAGGRAGLYNSWHPPVMSWLLGQFDALVPGTLLFLIFQSGLLLAALLAFLWLKPRGWASVAAAALIVLTPQWLLYQGEIWKDMLFADAAIAGFAALALYARTTRIAWLALSALLLGLAASTRQNGVVLLPVAALTLGLVAPRRRWAHGLGFLAATLALVLGIHLALAPRSDGGEGSAAEIRLGQSYDLAGALARQPGLALPTLAAEDRPLEQVLRHRGTVLYSPLHNDPFAADPAVNAALSDAPDGAIGRAWTHLVTDHPLLYLRVRWADFRAVLLTPDSFACHFTPIGVTGAPQVVKSLGLTAGIRPQDQALADYAKIFFATPVFSHLFWGALALVLLAWLARGDSTDRIVAGLLAGALLFTVTFVIISIACDYRYLVFLDLSAMAALLHAVKKV
jgi:hypothetical protein